MQQNCGLWNGATIGIAFALGIAFAFTIRDCRKEAIDDSNWSLLRGVNVHAFIIFGEMWYPVPDGNLVRIGSSNACDICLPYDQYISRRHCSLSLTHDELTIVDLNSSHGTLVNGQQVGSVPLQLHEGDRILIGHTELQVHFDRKRKPSPGSMLRKQIASS